MLILYFILLTLFAGWWLGTIEIPTGFSGLIATGTVKGKYMGGGLIIFIIAGGCLFSEQLTGHLSPAFSLTTPASAVIIAFSAFVAVVLTYRLSPYSSVCYGIIGAVIGWCFFLHKTVNFLLILKLTLSWLVAPVLSGVIAALLYMGYRHFIVKSNMHVLLLIRYLRVTTITVGILLAVCIGMNNGALLFALDHTISSGFGFSWSGINVGENSILLSCRFLCSPYLPGGAPRRK